MKLDLINEKVYLEIKRIITGRQQNKKAKDDCILDYNGNILIWNEEIVPRSDGKYPKKPDIFWMNKQKRKDL